MLWEKQSRRRNIEIHFGSFVPKTQAISLQQLAFSKITRSNWYGCQPMAES
jgi:hypothetical protein